MVWGLIWQVSLYVAMNRESKARDVPRLYLTLCKADMEDREFQTTGHHLCPKVTHVLVVQG